MHGKQDYEKVFTVAWNLNILADPTHADFIFFNCSLHRNDIAARVMHTVYK